MTLARFFKGLGTFLSLCSAVVVAIPVNTDGCSATNDPVSTCGSNQLSLAVLGDSWASGVAYNYFNQYDNNKDSCLRITEAYGAQMESDQTWLTSGTTLLFNFAACSGARLFDIVRGKEQVSELYAKTDVLVMTVGGNDAGFYDIAMDCIYHANPAINGFDYGPDYDEDPHRVGRCAKAIDFARDKINESTKLENDVRVTIRDMLNQKEVNRNPDIRIYQTGYAHYFNLDNDWCDNESFGAIPAGFLGSTKPKLTHLLRTDINKLTDGINDIIRSVTNEFSNRNVGYISITEGFDGHRFCEKGSTHWRQYYDTDVWFWNLSPPAPVAKTSNSTTYFSNTRELVAAFNANATGTTEPVHIPGISPDFVPIPLWENEDIAGTDTSPLTDGFALRPFHPKIKGHAVIKDAIIAQLKADKVPGVRL